MMLSRKLRSSLCLFLLLSPLIAVSSGSAERVTKGRSDFSVPAGLQPKVDFWKAMFTKYGKNDWVFHHRTYPEIVYSVVDVSEYEEKLTPKEFVRKRRALISAELSRIEGALRYLASGEKPSTPFQRRIEKMFKHVPGSARAKYYGALEENQLRFQQGIKERFRQGVVRSGRYLYAIEQILSSEGLPPEIGRLPLVESSFNYEAYSSAGAAGIWQFVRSTGSNYMRINSSIDERRDPVLASRAAAKYLRNAWEDLNGVWPLAITSYNYGLAGMVRATRETGSHSIVEIIKNYKGKSFGFASSNFYAEFLAALDVEQHAQRYFPGIVKEAPIHFDELRLGRALYFHELAQFARADSDTIAALNLGLRDSITSNRVKIPEGFLVKVPSGRGRMVVASVSGTRQVPLIGQTVMLASAQNAGEKELEEDARASLNVPKSMSLPPAATVRPSEETEEATPPIELASVNEKSAPAEIDSSAPTYMVQPGDTISSIAKKTHVSKATLMQANGISDPKSIRVGRSLSVPGGMVTKREATSKEMAGINARSYKIRKGDTINGVARKFSLSERELVAFNNLTGNKKLIPGKTIFLPRASARDRAKGKAKGKNGRKSYTVTSGDSLIKIAKRFNLKVDELRQLNPKMTDKLKPGQKLALQ